MIRLNLSEMVPPSELDTAIQAARSRIEEEEVPLLIALEDNDRPVWIREHANGASITTEAPGDTERGWREESHLQLWMAMNHACSAVIEALQSMTLIDDVRPKALHALLASGGHGYRLFEMDFAEAFLPNLRDIYQRAFAIMEHVLEVEPPDGAARYLRRIPKAYVFGLDAEAIILCRCALESAVADVFEAKGLEQPATMRARLDAARMFGWLDPGAREAGWRVWTNGNRVVHDGPGAGTDALATICDTVLVVTELTDA